MFKCERCGGYVIETETSLTIITNDMKTYFSCITCDHWQSKNNLEKAAKELANEMNRCLIIDIELKNFKKEFQDKIDALHQKFPRCKPLRFSIQNAKSYKAGDDIWIYCDGVFNMTLYLVKNKS